jgi:SAM-dependent methyltransferase
MALTILSTTNNTLGRLGNQIMRVQSIMGLAKKHNANWQIPIWPYAKYFENDIPQGPLMGVKLNEPNYHYTSDLLDGKTGNIDLHGFFQSPKYWYELLRFKQSFNEQIKAKYGITGNAIAISIRRGDFVGNSNYFQIPVTYYLSALVKHFADWEHRQIFIFSDDMDYCRHHFECLDNVTYVTGNDIEQLCAMTLCSDFIISNSTFSYCGAYLAQRGKVVRPVKNMAGALAAKNSEKDYWPSDWIIHDNEKLQLRDTTFTIPVFNDHADRRHNLALNVCMLQRDFDTNIIIGEQGKKDFEHMQQFCKYMHFPFEQFHRTKMLNDMAIEAQTPIVYNWDADVFMAPMQVWLAANKIRQGRDFVYPYDGRFARVPRAPWFKKLEHVFDSAVFYGQGFKGKGGKDLGSSVGGAVAVSKGAFIESGMENEYMISYAPEDCERWDRWHMLGYKVERVNGCLYHIDHYVGPNSSARHPLFKSNHEELDKIRAMNAIQLREYVDTWPWVNRYSESYYSKIAPGAIESAKIIYEAIGFKSGSVIDVGCGLGEWNNGNHEYYGTDYRVQKRSLLFLVEHYAEYDLRSSEPFPFTRKFDLCICLEVLEHVPEEFADKCVALLCSLSDTVLFGAAIPGQGGNGHVNEKFQTWWQEKFNNHGYFAQKTFRNLEGTEIWYKQNAVLYKKRAGTKIDDYVDKQMFLNIAKLAGTLK